MHIHQSSDNENQQPLDDFGQFFQTQAEGLMPDPPQEAWHRLEQKLESRRINRKLITYRYTSIAAAAVGVIALILAAQLIGRIGKFSEELAVQQDTLTHDEQRIAEAIRQHQAKQQPAPNTAAEPSLAPQAPAGEPTTAPRPMQPEKHIARRDAAPAPIRRKAKPDTAQPIIIIVQADDAAPQVVPQTSNAKDSRWEADEVGKEVADEVAEEVDAPILLEDVTQPAPTQSASKQPQTVTSQEIVTAPATTMNSPSSYTDKASGTRMRYGAAMQLYDWLSGDWTSEGKRWTVVRNGSVLRASVGKEGTWEILQERGNTVFTLRLNGDKRYEVTQQLGNQVVFERRGWGFPQQVTITRLAVDRISVRLSNGDGKLRVSQKTRETIGRYFTWDDSGATLLLIPLE